MDPFKAVAPLSRFPVETWERISTFLSPLDRKLLQFSFKACYNVLQLDAPPPLYKDDHYRFQAIIQDDWLKSPCYLVCMLCKRYHYRGRLQPRQDWGAKPNGVWCGCEGDGVRLSADKILCQLCWSDIVLKTRKIELQKPRWEGAFKEEFWGSCVESRKAWQSPYAEDNVNI